MLANMTLKQNFDVGFRGVLNFITFGSYKAIYLEQAVGKILMSTISLALSITWMKFDKPGMEIVEKVQFHLIYTVHMITVYITTIFLIPYILSKK